MIRCPLCGEKVRGEWCNRPGCGEGPIRNSVYVLGDAILDYYLETHQFSTPADLGRRAEPRWIPLSEIAEALAKSEGRPVDGWDYVDLKRQQEEDERIARLIGKPGTTAAQLRQIDQADSQRVAERMKHWMRYYYGQA